MRLENVSQMGTVLNRDCWQYIALNFLNKNDIASLMACNSQLYGWLKGHPRLTVDKIDWSYWDSMMANICDGQYGGDAYCLSIEYIDRGVRDFKEFAALLKECYPNLKELCFHQNYSYNQDYGWRNTHETGHEQCINLWESNFISFIQILNLTHLKIVDWQSSFFNSFNWDKLLTHLPERSDYILDSTEFDKDKERVIRLGTKSLTICNTSDE